MQHLYRFQVGKGKLRFPDTHPPLERPLTSKCRALCTRSLIFYAPALVSGGPEGAFLSGIVINNSTSKHGYLGVI